MGIANFHSHSSDPMNNNVSPAPNSQQAVPSLTPTPPPHSSGGSVEGSGGGSQGGSAPGGIDSAAPRSATFHIGNTLLRHRPAPTTSCPPPIIPQPQHYFRPIVSHHHRYGGGRGDDFDLTSDSDAVSSPTSSLVGPPPLPPLPMSLPPGAGGSGRASSHSHSHDQDHHVMPHSSLCYNGNAVSSIAPNQPGWMPSIFSPPTGSGGSGPLRFDESSFLGTSDACSSPETGSLPRTNKLTKRKRPPRPPPRRLKSEDYTLPEDPEDDRDEEDDEDPHLRHLMASGRCIDYGSWPRDSPSPVPSSGYPYQQQLAAVMSMSMGGRLEELQVEQENKETAMQLSEIRTQLQELTKSVESCQGEVTDVKRDMMTMRTDFNSIHHHVKEELDEMRECVDRIDELSRHRKTRLLEQGLTLFLCFSIFAAVLGMLQFGYNTGVINAPKQEIEMFMKEVHLERTGEKLDDDKLETLYSIVVAIFAIGGMLGGFSGGSIANRFGRKGGLLLNNLLGICGGCLMWLSKTSLFYEMLIVGRFVIGVHCGVNTVLVPMYVSEIAPLNLRGALGTVNQLAVCVGLFVSQVLGIQQLLGTDEGWPNLLGLTVAPAVLQMLLLPMCPESPRYLFITKQKEDEARRALRRFRASANVEEDVDEMRAEIQMRAQQTEASVSMLQLLRSSSLRAPLCIAIVMQLSQQLSGINAVLYYSTDFFKKAGLDPAQAKFATIGIGAIMVGMTLISIMLMDRAGRRGLHLYGLGGMFVFSLFITIAMLCKELLDWISYLAVIFTLSFVVFFAVGPGSIPWLITAELFSQGPRPSAMAFASLTNWLANFLVSISFLWMQKNLGSYVFLPFSVLLAIFWTFTYRKVPETKNKTFEEISAMFKRRTNSRAPSDESHIYGTLNCVNSMGQPMMHESSALIEEKHPPESSASGRSSRVEMSSPPGSIPPPPVPFSIPPYPPHAQQGGRYLDENAV